MRHDRAMGEILSNLKEAVPAVQGLTFAGKAMVTAIILLVAAFSIHTIWQPKQQVKSDTLVKSPEADAQNHAGQQLTGNAVADQSVDSERQEAAQTGQSRLDNRRPVVRSEPNSILLQQPSGDIKVGNVNSTNQSGGITAGYVGKVEQRDD